MNQRLLAGCLTGLLAAATGAALEAEQPGQPPNIVIIFADDMAPQYVGCYGGAFPTPNIDALAREGIRFTRAYCVSSMCTPSRYSLLTARYPGRCTDETFRATHPVDEPYSIAWNTWMEEGVRTLATRLNALGYQTGFVGKWHLGAGRETGPDIAEDADPLDPDVDVILKERHRVLAEHVKRVTGFDVAESVLKANYEEAPVRAVRVHNFEWALNGALSFLDQVDPEQPFCLYFASTAVHGPSHAAAFTADVRVSPGGLIDPPSDYFPDRGTVKREIESRGMRAGHREAGLAFLDHQVAGIRKKLAERQLDKNTIVLFAADHGVEPGKSTSYEFGSRIPMIVAWPNQIAGGRVSDEIVQLIDVLPTFWEAAGGAPLPPEEVDGVSFLPALRGEPFTGRTFAYFENGYTRSVLTARYHFIAWRAPESTLRALAKGERTEAPDHLGKEDWGHASIAMQCYPGYWSPDQLYDLASDPYEQRNLAGNPAYAEIESELRAQLAKQLSSLDHAFDLGTHSYQFSAQYSRWAAPRMRRGTDGIPWWNPGNLTWPPEREGD